MKIVSTKAFTLIELLVSVTIIFMLMLATIPGFDKIRSRNVLRTNGNILRDCVLKAKTLALSPDVSAQDVEYYRTSIGFNTDSDTTRQNRCIIELKQNSSATVDPTPVAVIKFNSVIKVINSSTNDEESNYLFRPTKNGAAEVKKQDGITDGGSTSFFLSDETDRCLTIEFVKESGELFIEDIGQVDLNAIPPTCL